MLLCQALCWLCGGTKCKKKKTKNLAILVEHTRKRGTNDYKIQQNMLINGHELNRLLAF